MTSDGQVGSTASLSRPVISVEGTSTPRISVIMIFLDPGRYFAEAVDSVLAQTYPQFELLLCDDGSADEATSFARAMAARHPAHVRYVQHDRHAHRGMSATRNLGIAAASGELVAFLDADDVWAPEHLDREAAVLALHPEAEAVCGQAVTWRSWADSEREDETPPTAWPTGTVVHPPRMLEALLQRGETATPTCSLLVRRASLLAVEGGETAFTGMYEDQVILAKLYLSGPVVIGGTRTAFYRQHDSSASAGAIASGAYHPSRVNESRTAWLEWLQGYCRSSPAAKPVTPLIESELRTIRAATPNATGSKGAVAARRLVRRASRRLVRRLRIALVAALPTSPLSRIFGFDRGEPIDRYYIDRFLSKSRYLVRGSVLEAGDSSYTHRFGGAAVSDAQVLNVAPEPGTTIVADLGAVGALPEAVFDCVLLTQTLQLVFDLRTAVENIHRSLRPGGTALVTVPFISQISDERWDGTWSWGISPSAARRLFEESFGEGQVQVESYGNMRAATAFLEGFVVDELRGAQLDVIDSQYPMLVAVRAWRAL